MGRITRYMLGLAIGAGLSLSALSAQAAVIDIDSIGGVHGTVVNTQFPGVTISRLNSSNPAVAFNTSLSGTNDPDLEAPFEAPIGAGSLPAGLSPGPTNPGFILVSNNNSQNCGTGICSNVNDAVGSTLRFDFDETVDLQFLDLFDLDDGGSSAEITLFSGGTQTVNGAQVGDNGSLTVDIAQFFGSAQTNVDAFEVRFQGSGGLDRIVFDPPGTDVPEPATLALVGTGLLAAGALTRRRRRV